MHSSGRIATAIASFLLGGALAQAQVPAGYPADYKSIVDGARKDKGMVSFKSVLAEGQAEAIFHFIISQANKDKATEQAARH